jgi:glycosyltransferase involved in cell wall biosynthesis
MADFFKSQGHDVYFIYSNQETANIEEMRKYWGNNLYVVNYNPQPDKYTNKWLALLLNTLNKDRKYYSDVDDFYNRELDKHIQALTKEITFNAVIVEYIFLSKALLNFPPSVIKIIDTHDVMTNRHRLFLEKGEKPVWYSTSAKQEKTGVDRADRIIAIQQKEKNHFSKLTKKSIATIGHMVDIHKTDTSLPPRKKILFMGSNNPSNVIGITSFIRDIFPTLKDSIPELELLIVGSVCSQINDQPSVIKMGEMPDLDAIYNLSDIIINPLTLGTGLKIKSIEALGYSKALITTSVGADGLEDGINTAFFVANNKQEFCNALNAIIFDSDIYTNLCTNAANFVDDWNDKIKTGLSGLLV